VVRVVGIRIIIGGSYLRKEFLMYEIRNLDGVLIARFRVKRYRLVLDWMEKYRYPKY